ncbi:hypothetical protein TDB9533_03971 [Thalassocella blandensis]|nr:hypothetical protein TDB9533_03971 [Thalassocella blandensis]
MEQMSFANVYYALGLFPPWDIVQVKVNDDAREIHVYVEQKSNKSMFRLFDQRSSSSQETRPGTWQHGTIGGYKSFIHANVAFDPSMRNAAIPLTLVEQPSFLGHPARRYTNHLRQRVAVSQLYGIDADQVSKLLNIDSEIVQAINEDIRRSQQFPRLIPYIPVESDAVWSELISDKLRIRTESMPLKYLLSKLKIAASKIHARQDRFPLVIELREFFIKNCKQMEKEIEQLCGIVSDKQRKKASVATNRQKLVLPRHDHPVWGVILSGTELINSKNYAFSLFYTQQRSMFNHNKSADAKGKAISNMREYIKQKYTQLRPEIVHLNEIYYRFNKASAEDRVLPPENNLVWKSILENQFQIGSNHMGFNLMLSQLKMKLAKRTHSSSEAARLLRKFMLQNRSSMSTEIQKILSHAV